MHSPSKITTASCVFHADDTQRVQTACYDQQQSDQLLQLQSSLGDQSMFVTSEQFRLSDTIGFDPGPVYVGFVVDKVALGQVFPCQFHSTGAPLLVKLKKKKLIIFLFIFIIWVAQEALRLRCVRSFCCGTLKQSNTIIQAMYIILFFCHVLSCIHGVISNTSFKHELQILYRKVI